MINAICKEIELQKNYLKGDKIETIYFGGGTPSLLNEKDFDLIFNKLNKHFSLSNLKEVTLEANPDDLTKDKIGVIKNTLINRFSIGIQSFYDDDLTYLNRAHNSKEALNSVKIAQDFGFDNITVDLIFGIPNSTIEQWSNNVEKALDLDVPHLSCYALTIEEKTVFGNWLKKGKLNVMDDDIVNSQFELLMEKSFNVGYEQYEISNYAKLNYRAIHNTNYWTGKKYLGIGPGAHSFNGLSRQYNVSNNPKYIEAINNLKPSFEIEILTHNNKVNEYIMTSLRTSWGCDMMYLKKEFEYDILNINETYLQKYTMDDLLIENNNILTLTRKGKFIADEIASQLFI